MGGENSIWDDGGFVQVEKRRVIGNESFTKMDDDSRSVVDQMDEGRVDRSCRTTRPNIAKTS